MTPSDAGRLGSLAGAETRRIKSESIRTVYNLNPNTCNNIKCLSPTLPFERRHNKFCSKSCSAIHNNGLRPSSNSSQKQYTSKISYQPIVGKVVFVCINCGQEKRAALYRNIIYCNSTCQHDYKRKQTFLKVEQGFGSASQAKRYLLEKYSNTCLAPDCAWDFSKKSVNVELEHIDGNSTNNKLENLTLLCPNCHSSTPTYKAKNKGNGRASRRERYRSGKSY